ncbi:MAG: tRNA 2-thiouridine(34) synthase MnmA [Pseudomonadota bacterium]|nr:tRNA 2-thiouridine(34) synthase MnmA [Pseudomonadota bacterium]
MHVSDEILAAAKAAIDLPGEPANHRVVVAMSGGVDSSCAAGLVRQAGFDAVGITLQLYDHGAATRRTGACCAGQDIHDARRVAAMLGMPHYVLDYESRFRESVIDDFAAGYLRGETPIPCIRCNQTVKFDDLIGQARALGASALVTGHYVASARRGDGSGHRMLLTPFDAARDQSYFLYATTQEQLDYVRFPLAHLDKQATRALAAAMGLQVAAKPDSQDICFVPQGRYQEIISRLRPDATEPGDLVHVDGRVLRRHDGIINFTVGQRRGLGVADGEPLYVVRLEPEERKVIVGPKAALRRRQILLKDVNWLGGGDVAAADGVEVFVRIRSTRPPARATLRVSEQQVIVVLDEDEFGVAPGQACVFYERTGSGARVLGGGVIARQAVDEGCLTPRQANIALETSRCVTI